MKCNKLRFWSLNIGQGGKILLDSTTLCQTISPEFVM